jgi:hypothetical protein
MNEADPDAIGPDGTLRLRCYLSMADSVWLSAGCEGSQGCQHAAPTGIRAAIWFAGSAEATVGGARVAPAVQPVRQLPGCHRLPARHATARDAGAQWAAAGNAGRAAGLSRFRGLTQRIRLRSASGVDSRVGEMAGKAPVTAGAEEQLAVQALEASRDRGEADRARVAPGPPPVKCKAALRAAMPLLKVPVADRATLWTGLFAAGDLLAETLFEAQLDLILVA